MVGRWRIRRWQRKLVWVGQARVDGDAATLFVTTGTGSNTTAYATTNTGTHTRTHTETNAGTTMDRLLCQNKWQV